MKVKRYGGGRVYEVEFNEVEKQAMYKEIGRQLAEYSRKHEREVDSMFLWYVHEKLGLGPYRLKDLHDDFIEAYKGLAARYEMDDCDMPWLYTTKLKKYLEEKGIDYETWFEEEISEEK